MTRATRSPTAGPVSRQLEEGERVGRFLVLRDLDGRLHAVSASAIGAMPETDEGTVLALPGARHLHVSWSLEVMLA